MNVPRVSSTKVKLVGHFACSDVSLVERKGVKHKKVEEEGNKRENTLNSPHLITSRNKSKTSYFNGEEIQYETGYYAEVFTVPGRMPSLPEREH